MLMFYLLYVVGPKGNLKIFQYLCRCCVSHDFPFLQNKTKTNEVEVYKRFMFNQGRIFDRSNL